VPWLPELFSAPVLERVLERRREDGAPIVPYFQGLMAGELSALLGSFSGEPEIHYPVRGRVRGVQAFESYVGRTIEWITGANGVVENVELLVTPRRSVEEVIVRLDGEDGRRIEVPCAIAVDRGDDGRLREMRVYYSNWPMTGGHAIRPPMLQPDPDASEGDIVGEYQRALAAGDVEGVVAAFAPDAHVREPAGTSHIHRGTDELRALFTQFFSNGGGIPLEHCTVTDDGRACAIEYNVVAWGQTKLPPQAGVAVYVRGESGKLAAARIYDDVDPPL
jgi:ketosteroid isomerase-like protein